MNSLPRATAINLVSNLTRHINNLVNMRSSHTQCITNHTASNLSRQTMQTRRPLLINIRSNRRQCLKRIRSLSRRISTCSSISLTFTRFTRRFSTPRHISIKVRMFSLSTTFRRMINRVLNRLLNRYHRRHTLIFISAILSLNRRIISLPLNQTRISLQISRANQSSSLLSRTIQRARLVITKHHQRMCNLPSTIRRLQPFRQTIIRHKQRARPVFSRHTLTKHISLMRHTSLQRNSVQLISSRRRIVQRRIRRHIQQHAKYTIIRVPQVILRT